ncbi:MAG: hypothetical protein WC373_03695 [Smithella sp.]
MKRFWLMMLSLGLVMAFSVSAFAVDVKISGEYFAAGMYLANNNVKDDNSSNSTAFFYQRLRVGTDFIVSPGLKLVTRFDAMERIWGGARDESGATAADSAGTVFENENIAVDWAYVNYVSPIGTFDVGMMDDGSTGTIFGNSYKPAARIKYAYKITPEFSLGLAYTKAKEQSYSVVSTSTDFTDGDNDKYGIKGEYKWKDGKAGLNINYYRYAEKRPGSDYMKNYYLFTPYAFAKIGPVALQAELNYATGKNKKYDDGVGDQTLESYSAFVDATATFAPVYVGATLAYVSGDDPTTSKNEGTLNGGNDWNPCLILFNYYDVAHWVGSMYGYDGTKVTGPMTNAIFAQGRVGVKPISTLDAMLSVSYAKADEVTYSGQDKDYGWEVDLTGIYKITNNLSYVLGIGYLFTGDYFKAGSSNDINDDYVVMNKLTLTF